MAKRQVLEIPGISHAAPIPMAVKMGNLLFSSAIMGEDPETHSLPPEPERQAELDKQAEEQAAKQKKIDDENARLAQEKADKEEADRKAVEEEVARKTELERAPDREKLLLYASDIEQLVGTGPVMQSQEGANTLIFACEQLTEVADTVRKCVEEMK